MGNILGRIGSGKTVIMMDSHTDTVGVGDPKEWAWDPYQGKVEDGYVYGRGACDQRAGMASMVYAGKMIKELGLARRLHALGGRLGAGRGLRRPAVALHPEGRRHPRPIAWSSPSPASLRHLSRPSRTHGDRSSPARQVVPRQRARARRQSHLQDEPPGAGSREAEHAPARRSVPRQGHHRRHRDPLALALALRGAGRLLHPPRPPPDGRRDQGERASPK